MESLKQRILTGWNFTRILYAGLGTVVIINSSMNQQWFGVLIGTYFASMGIFAFGCAAGNCFGGNCNSLPIDPSNREIKDINFEEVKQK